MIELQIVLVILVVAVVNLGLMVLAYKHFKRFVERNRSRLEYDDLECEPVGAHELPDATRGYFDSLTPEMILLGFRLIGDHRIRSSPLVLERRFISADHRTFALIVDWKHMPIWHTRTFEFASVLADGTFVASGATKIPSTPINPDEPDLLRMLGVPKASVQELYERHLDYVRELAQSGGSPPLEFEPGEIKEVANYGHQLVVWKSRYHCGIESEPPTLAKVEAASLAETTA